MEHVVLELQAAIQRARRICANALADAAHARDNADAVRSLTGLNMALVGCEYYVADILAYVEMLEQGDRALQTAEAPPTEGTPNAG